MNRNHQNNQPLVPRDFLGLGTSNSSKDLNSHSNKLVGPFCLQIPDGEVSLAKLQQMSEQTGFQLASAFSAPRYNGFHVAALNGKCNTPPANLPPVGRTGFLNGGYRAGYFPTEEQRVAALQFLRASANKEMVSRVRPASDSDVQLLSRDECRKYFKDNRGTRWPVQASRNNNSPHFQLAQAQEALNLWNAANHVPSRTMAPVPAATTTLSLGQPGLQEEANKSDVQQMMRQQQQQPNSSNPQLTIFYAGSVNVFDNVPSDRAKAVMLLAGSLAPGSKSWASGPENAAALRALLTAAGKSQPPLPPVASSATPSQTTQVPPVPQASQTPSSSTSGVQQICTGAVSLKALPQARKASLARFLERRKERCILKSSADTSSSGKTDLGCTDKSCDQPADADSREKEQKPTPSMLETANTQEVATC